MAVLLSALLSESGALAAILFLNHPALMSRLRGFVYFANREVASGLRSV